MSSDGETLVNLDRVNRIFINDAGDAVLIGADFGAEKPARLGRYCQVQTAREELTAILDAMMDNRAYYAMPDDRIDSPTPRKIMDSRVRRKGGS
jgi:hypothetical protein